MRIALLYASVAAVTLTISGCSSSAAPTNAIVDAVHVAAQPAAGAKGERHPDAITCPDAASRYDKLVRDMVRSQATASEQLARQHVAGFLDELESLCGVQFTRSEKRDLTNSLVQLTVDR